jgi:hypothetical protein
MSRPAIIALIVFLFSLAYATTRYIVFGTVAIEQLPVYIVNKAVAVTGLGLLAGARFVRERQVGRTLGLIGASFIGLHTLLSLMILQPACFPRLHNAAGKMTGSAELSMLAGAVALGLLAIMLWSSPRRDEGEAGAPAEEIPPLARVVLAAAALHSLVLGYAVWRKPGEWPGGLPPITMISFLIAVAGLLPVGGRKRVIGSNLGN